ncbi:hypothetical protein QWY31_11020 [Cytophagales bacterium LB-30]|uniref:Lipoprotein n=1 Tax=Shiella aurantiaca TaxID=3058365 RepID=A0ABT8F6D5_9BACT|nr:hypothetical protein [Shiella aurantiaca]MDN4166036.1 hypothetical protein [Shiella aurantiaca]
MRLLLLCLLFSSASCVSLQREQAQDQLSVAPDPLVGNWINKRYADKLKETLSPYQAAKQFPYEVLSIRVAGIDSLLVQEIKYEESESNEWHYFTKEASLYQQVANREANCTTCTYQPCKDHCQQIRFADGNVEVVLLDQKEFVRMPNLCPYPDKDWWLCLDYWVNQEVIAGNYAVKDVESGIEFKVQIFDNGTITGWPNRGRYLVWNWFQAEQEAYAFDVLQFTTNDYTDDQFDFSEAYALERDGGVIRLYRTAIHPETRMAEKHELAFELFKK